MYGEFLGRLLVVQLSLSRDASKMAGMVLTAPAGFVASTVMPPWPIVWLLRFLATDFPWRLTICI